MYEQNHFFNWVGALVIAGPLALIVVAFRAVDGEKPPRRVVKTEAEWQKIPLSLPSVNPAEAHHHPNYMRRPPSQPCIQPVSRPKVDKVKVWKVMHGKLKTEI
ncbi:MAG: hypothetical protein H7Z72_14825 [Bacteroidetes bacterium]|nr:hypothetical protein [Fibrella sp.]